MTRRERLVRGPVRSEHIVHFFDDRPARVAAITRFLSDALQANRSVIVVARNVHWQDVREKLTADRIAAGLDSRLVVLDARATLDTLMRDGTVVPELFQKVIAPLVRDVSAASPAGLSVYGEMVDLLAAEGEFDAATSLEACWNGLAAEALFTLLCGYSSAHFTSTAHRDQLAAICGCHESVRTDSADALGQWLVDQTLPGAVS